MDIYEKIVFYLNKIWIIQIFIGLIYCWVKKIYFPDKNNMVLLNSILIKQIRFYLITHMMVYLMQMLFSNLIFQSFDCFLHHMLSIFLFLSTLYEPHVISVSYLVPYFMHCIYWFIDTDMIELLVIYNIFLVMNSLIVVIYAYQKKIEIISIRIPLACVFIFNVNLFGLLYGFDLNLNNINIIRFWNAFGLSTISSMPLYVFFIFSYLKISKRNIKCTKNTKSFLVYDVNNNLLNKNSN